MPKQKTHKGTKKRFRLTARGKAMHRSSGTSHLAQAFPTSGVAIARHDRGGQDDRAGDPEGSERIQQLKFGHKGDPFAMTEHHAGSNASCILTDSGGAWREEPTRLLR